MQFIFCINKPELFIKLWSVVALAANDLKNQFCKEPIHLNLILVMNGNHYFDPGEPPPKG